jgi:broad specificity phosphatase PhoE
MHVYFIRHGETEYNRRRLHQDGTVPLSDRGRAQMLKAASKLKTLPITKVISSDFARAVESGEIIGRELGLQVEQNPLFREVKRPSVLYNRSHYSFMTLKVGLAILANLNRKYWRYSDEENLCDLKARVAEAVAYLKDLGDEHEHVVVVTHGLITSLFIKYMCTYKDVRVRDYLRTLFAAFQMTNGAISTVVFKDDSNPLTCDWMCIDLNSRAHLKNK